MSFLDLSPAVALLSLDTLSVQRSTVAYNTHGVLVTTLLSPFSISCSAQPLSGKDLDRLPEGQRTRGGLLTFTAQQLEIATTPGVASDVITYRGQDYAVVASEQWDIHGYWRSTLIKVEV